MDFSETLSGLLEEKQITQKELAKACGLSPQCVSALITGRNNPTGTTLVALSRFLNISADYLLGLEDDFGAKQFSAVAPTYTKAEQNIIEDFRQLSPNCQKIVRDTITNFLSVAARGSNKNIS